MPRQVALRDKLTRKAAAEGMTVEAYIEHLLAKHGNPMRMALAAEVAPNAMRERLISMGYSFVKDTGEWEQRKSA